MPKLKFGNALLCDHASVGSNNKHTVVGIYSSDIYIESLPATIIMGTYIEHIPDKTGEMKMKLSFKINGSQVLAVEAMATVQKNKLGVLLIPAVPLSIEKAGTFNLTAESEGYAPVTIMTKKVIEGAPPTSPTA
jgi:hypothetical protein